MARRFVRGSYGRLALTVVALALGVGLVCAIDLVNRAVVRAFVEVIDTMAGRAALQVTAGEAGLFAEEVAATVASVPGVELAVPVVSTTAFIADDSGEQLTVHGVDITNDKAVRVYDARDNGGLALDDPLTFLNQPDSVVLTRALATRRGLGVGDQIALMTPTGRRSFTVRALLEPQGVARVYGGNLVVMDVFAAEAVFTRPGFVNRVDVVVNRDDDVTRVASAVAAVLPAGFRVEAPAQRAADLHKIMQSLHAVVRGVSVVGLVAAFLIAFNRLTTVFERRVWQLGVMRAVGARSRVLWQCLVAESVLLGVIGVALGIPLGIAMGRALLPAIATTTALAYNLVAPDAALRVSGSSLVMAAGLGLAAALLAAALPAWRATQQGMAETIRSRGVELQTHFTRHAWLVRAVLAVAIVAAVVLQSATRSATWGLLATGLIAAGTAVAARPLLQLLGAPAASGLRWLAGPSAQFAAAALVHNPRRMALTAATLGVGLGSVLWLLMLAGSFEKSVVAMLSTALRSDLMVSSSHVVSGTLEAPIDEGLVGEIQKVPGVVAVATQRMIDWPYQSATISLHSFDPAYLADPQFGRFPLFGRHAPDVWETVARGDAVVVSSNFMLHTGRNVGDRIELETPNGRLTLPIAGVTTDFVSPFGTIQLSRAVFRKFWDDNAVTTILVRTAPGARDDVRAAIARHWGARYGLRILSSGEFVDYFAHQVRRAFAGLHVITILVLFVVLAGLTDTLAAGVMERTREFGSVRALGVRRRYVRRIVLCEALLLGALGLVLALCAGLALGTLWVTATFPFLIGWTLDLHIPYGPAVLASVVTGIVCAAAALLPARRAARLEPAVALRYE